MDIRHLRLFLQTLEQGSISGAAAEMGLSQPALSKQLNRLEEELGVELLDRLPRGVQASAHGEILEHYARAIDASYRNALRHLSTHNQREAGEITIGGGYFWLHGLLPKAVGQLTSKYPRARVKIVAGVPEDLIDMLLGGRLDLVLGPISSALPYGDLIKPTRLIRTDTEVLVRKGHPDADGTDKSLSDLAKLDWVLPAGTHVRRRFDQVFNYYGFVPPKPKVEVNDVHCTLDIVSTSNLATLATSFTPMGAQRDGLERIKCSNISNSRETGVLQATSSMVPWLGGQFLDILAELSRNHPNSVTTKGV